LYLFPLFFQQILDLPTLRYVGNHPEQIRISIDILLAEKESHWYLLSLLTLKAIAKRCLQRSCDRITSIPNNPGCPALFTSFF